MSSLVTSQLYLQPFDVDNNLAVVIVSLEDSDKVQAGPAFPDGLPSCEGVFVLSHGLAPFGFCCCCVSAPRAPLGLGLVTHRSNPHSKEKTDHYM